MSAWIGPLGNLIEFKCPSAVESDSRTAHVYFEPLGGSIGVSVLGDAVRPRVWNVSVSAARPDHVASLESIASGQWGLGPFVFIPPAAPALNLLGKRDAMAMSTPPAGYVAEAPGTPVPTTEGVSGSGYGWVGSGTPSLVRFGVAPVIPGQPVTAKAWVAPAPDTTGTLRIEFLTAGHANAGNAKQVYTNGPGGQFLHTTTTAPEGAAYVALGCAGSTVTRPQVTWTAEPRTWAPSAASQNVVVSPLSNSVRRATGTIGEAQITDHAFTVTELTA